MRTKKVFTSLFLTAAMVATLVGCGQTQPNNAETSAGNSIMTLKATELIEEVKVEGIADFSTSAADLDKNAVEQINYYLEYSPVYKHVTSGVAEANSIIGIDYVGKIGGVEFAGGTATNQILDLANSTYIAGFAEQCVGHSVGETFDITVTFPADYEGEYYDADNNVQKLANAEAVFTITIQYLAGEQIKTYDDLDNQAVVDLTGGENTTVEEFYETIKSSILESSVSSMEVQMWDTLVSEIKYLSGKEATVQKYIDDKYNHEIEYYKTMAEYYEQEYLDFITTSLNFESEEAFNNYLKEDAKYIINQNIIVDYVAEKNNLVITDEDYSKLALEMAKEYGYETVEAFETDYDKVEIYEYLQYQKVTDFMMELNGYTK